MEKLTDINGVAKNVTQTSEHLSYLGSSIFQFISTELEKGNVNYCGSKERNPKFSKTCCGLHIVLCTLYIVSFGKFIINVNCVKDEKGSDVKPIDILGI